MINISAAKPYVCSGYNFFLFLGRYTTLQTHYLFRTTANQAHCLIPLVSHLIPGISEHNLPHPPAQVTKNKNLLSQIHLGSNYQLRLSPVCFLHNSLSSWLEQYHVRLGKCCWHLREKAITFSETISCNIIHHCALNRIIRKRPDRNYINNWTKRRNALLENCFNSNYEAVTESCCLLLLLLLWRNDS